MVKSHLRQALGLCAVFFVLLGLAYPLVLTGIGQTLFHDQASGSLTANGSALVGQTWTGPRWFHGRPDADDPMATGGTNLGPRSKELVSTVRRQLRLLAAEGITPTVDLATPSGSGVDPDISPADAYAQVAMIAKARSLPAAQIMRLIASHIQNPQLGFLGSAYINVLHLNEALARLR